MAKSSTAWLAGVDGCKGGWIVAYGRVNGETQEPRFVKSFCEIIFSRERPKVIAIDVPIGLPAFSPVGGRLPEPAIRVKLGARRSSVFRVPSRRAVYASVSNRASDDLLRYRRACKIARRTSQDRRAFSLQGFYIFDKVVQVDEFLRDHPSYKNRVRETHPELAFWRMNRNTALDEPKHTARGQELRRALLHGAGISKSVTTYTALRGKPDDSIDALACLVTARHLYNDCAKPFPECPKMDECGLTMAIWA